MNLRGRRPDPKLRDVVLKVIGKYVGRDPRVMNNMQINEHIEGKMDTNSKSPMLDMNFGYKYEPSIGFMCKANALHNLKDKGFFFILSSLLPPAAHYQSKLKREMDSSKKTGNTFTFFEPDFKSNQYTYEFKDAENLVVNAKPECEHALSIYFDVKWYNLATEQFEDYGFTVCPILETD